MAKRRKKRKIKPEGEVVVSDISPDIVTDLSNATASTIEQLRTALWLQRQHRMELMEETLRKFYEFLKKHFENSEEAH